MPYIALKNKRNLNVIIAKLIYKKKLFGGSGNLKYIILMQLITLNL